MHTITLKPTTLTVALVLNGTAYASAAPIATNGCALRLLSASPAGDTAADLIAAIGSSLYDGYGHGHESDSSNGLSGTIVNSTPKPVRSSTPRAWSGTIPRIERV